MTLKKCIIYIENNRQRCLIKTTLVDTMDKIQVFEQLLAEYDGTIKRRCFLWSKGDEEQGKDAYQEVLQVIWKQLDDEGENHDGYKGRLWVINQTRRALQACRGKYVKGYPITDSHINTLVEANATERSALETINELYEYLDHDEKQLLKYIEEGYDNKDIAILMNVRPNAINQRRYRLTAKMREIYNKLYNR